LKANEHAGWRRISCWIAGAAVFVGLVNVSRQSLGDQSAILSMEIAGYTTGISASNTYGWAFRPEANITLTQLGVWDQGGDGLSFPHEVGIWNSQQTLVATALIPAGTAADLVNGFRQVLVYPTPLTAGEQYVLGASYAPNMMDPITNPISFIADPNVTWQGFVYTNSGSGFAYPVNGPLTGPPGEPVYGTFGPSFSFVVPEPSAVGLLLGTGAILLLARQRWWCR
jgi:hypothetical protein